MTLNSNRIFIPILSAPFVNTLLNWSALPEKIPIHWNANGEVDIMAGKLAFTTLTAILPLGLYLLFHNFSIQDKQNSKNHLNKMKLLFTSFIGLLMIFLTYSVQYQDTLKPEFIFLFIGLLFVGMGVQFRNLKQNKHFGIRTVWTRKDTYVWSQTHKFGSIIWIISGCILTVIAFYLSLSEIVNLAIILILFQIGIPMLYSYFIRKKTEI